MGKYLTSPLINVGCEHWDWVDKSGCVGVRGGWNKKNGEVLNLPIN